MPKVICIHEYKLKRDNPSLFGKLYDIRSEDDLLKEVNKNKEKKDNVIYIKPKVKRRRPKK